MDKKPTVLPSKATVLNLKKNVQPPSAKSDRSIMSASQQSIKSLTKQGLKPKSTAGGAKDVPSLSSYEAIDPLHKEVRNPLPLQKDHVIAAPDKHIKSRHHSESNLMTPKSPGSMVRFVSCNNA